MGLPQRHCGAEGRALRKKQEPQKNTQKEANQEAAAQRVRGSRPNAGDDRDVQSDKMRQSQHDPFESRVVLIPEVEGPFDAMLYFL